MQSTECSVACYEILTMIRLLLLLQRDEALSDMDHDDDDDDDELKPQKFTGFTDKRQHG